MTRLTLRRLKAIEEALGFRLAGPIETYPDDDEMADLRESDYARAHDWVCEQIARRNPA